MNRMLKLLANPLCSGLLFLLFGLSIPSPAKSSDEFSAAMLGLLILIYLLFFSLPAMILSVFTRSRFKHADEAVCLVAMWITSVIASLAWTMSILISDNPQAGLGFINMPLVIVGGGAAGYIIGRLLMMPKSK